MSHSLFSFVQGLLLHWLPLPDHFLVVALVLAGVTAAIATLVNGRNPVFSDNNWATPLTTVGGILGIVLLAHSSQVTPIFIDLNIFFGALVAIGALFYAAVQPLADDKAERAEQQLSWSLLRRQPSVWLGIWQGNWPRNVMIGLAVLLTLWAVFGELLATLFLVSIVTPFITWLLRACLLLAFPVAIYYVCFRLGRRTGTPSRRHRANQSSVASPDKGAGAREPELASRE